MLCLYRWLTSISELLTQLIAISKTLNEGEGQLTRAKHKLAILYSEKGMAARLANHSTRLQY